MFRGSYTRALTTSSLLMLLLIIIEKDKSISVHREHARSLTHHTAIIHALLCVCSTLIKSMSIVRIMFARPSAYIYMYTKMLYGYRGIHKRQVVDVDPMIRLRSMIIPWSALYCWKKKICQIISLLNSIYCTSILVVVKATFMQSKKNRREMQNIFCDASFLLGNVVTLRAT